MTEHHGLDIDAINAASGGHSIFAPSASAMWLVCSGSLIPNILAPDDAGYDAAYGTVGHEVGEEWLLRIDELRRGLEAITDDMVTSTRPDYLIGTTRTIKERLTSYDIQIDEDMLAYVAEYIRWCVDLPGDHFIEQRVYFSQLTPIPEQGGTADHAACEPGVLTITDLKMGESPLNIVYAAEDDQDPRSLITTNGIVAFNGNPQAMLYALGFFYKWDRKYNFQRIIIRIAQPRLEHFHVWETTREELLRFADYVKVRAADAWVPDAPRTPSKKGCRWCRVKATCPALVEWTNRAVDGVFDAVADEFGWDGDVDPHSGALVMQPITKQEMVKAKQDTGTGSIAKAWVEPRSPTTMTTEEMAAILPMQTAIEGWFKAIREELTNRAYKHSVAVPGFKLASGREGNRKFDPEVKESDLIETLKFIGLEDEDLYVTKLASPAHIAEKLKVRYGLKKAVADMLIDGLVKRKPGTPTLVPIAARRDELADLGTVFDAVPDDDL